MSSNGWPRVPLGNIVSHRKEFIQICETEQYKRCRVQLGARGIILRDQIMGCDIKTKKQQVCHSGEFLVAEIDAKVGGFGIVPESLEGAIVSSHYFLYTINNGRINKSFLAYYIKTPAFQEQINAQGSTNYSAIRSHQVLEYEIPLPDRKEQNRIVAKLDALSARIDEARECSRQIEQEAIALCRSVIHSAEASEKVELSRLLKLRSPDVEVEPHLTYEFAGVYSFGRGVFKGPVKTGMEFSYPRLTRLREGDFVYPKLMAWEGALGVVPPDCDSLVVSTEFPVFEINTELMLPEVLDIYFRSPDIWPLLSGTSTGTNVRRRRLKPADFLKFRMPLPSRTVQFQLREIVKRTSAMHENVATMITQLDAMLPSILDKAFKGEL